MRLKCIKPFSRIYYINLLRDESSAIKRVYMAKKRSTFLSIPLSLIYCHRELSVSFGQTSSYSHIQYFQP
jgi:hypothetical protein